MTETWDTPDILAEEGYEYVCDWVLDDQPVMLKTRTRPLMSVPYTQECNDVAMMLIQHHKASEYRDRAIDQFEQLYADAQQSARIMALVAHPYIMGVPHRLRYFREALEHIQSRSGVVFWTGEQILDWYLADHEGSKLTGFPAPVVRGIRCYFRTYTPKTSLSARFAAKYPHIPWTPTPGGVDAEQRYRPFTGVEYSARSGA